MLKPLEHPLTIFASFEHTQEPICRKIIEGLMARGHQVWFDSGAIQPVDDWRKRIESGIKASQVAIFFMSKRAVSDPGVCLVELDITMRANSCKLCAVLLEPEREVNPPAALCQLQWFDMSDWKERLDTPGFDAWFEEKMNQLIETVEGL